MKDLTVLLLIGGNSDRFWPLGDKHWFFILGEPILYHAISQLVQFGIVNIVIVGNDNNLQKTQKLKHIFPKINISLIKQYDLRGMGGAVVSAQKYIHGKKILIINPADIYEDLLLYQLKESITGKEDAVITGVTCQSYFPGGYMSIDNGFVKGIIEKPHPDKRPSNFVSLVFDYFQNADVLLQSLESINTSSDDLFERAIDSIIKKGKKVRFLHYKGYWGHIKFPWDCLDITSYFLKKIKRRIHKTALIDKSAKITGDVQIEENVRMLENSKVVGPAYIGRGTIIGNNSVIRDSNIGSYCVIGYSTEIARSTIGNNCWFHTNYIGDSVISDNVSMGAGTVLANFRLDEGVIASRVNNEIIKTHFLKLGSMIGKDVRIGINCSLMPGVKIGSNCVIAGAVALSEDIADGMFVESQIKKMVIKKNKIALDELKRETQRKLLKL